MNEHHFYITDVIRGSEHDLLVIPGDTYEIVYEGVSVTRLQFELEYAQWVQVEGNLDREIIEKIGDHIDNHYL